MLFNMVFWFVGVVIGTVIFLHVGLPIFVALGAGSMLVGLPLGILSVQYEFGGFPFGRPHEPPF